MQADFMLALAIPQKWICKIEQVFFLQALWISMLSVILWHLDFFIPYLADNEINVFFQKITCKLGSSFFPDDVVEKVN